MDLGQILLGGLLTAAGGGAVQLWVVPRAQAMTRGRDRWEKNMEELDALLEEELPRALAGLQNAGFMVRVVRQIPRLDPVFVTDPQTAAATLERKAAERRAANEAVGGQMARLRRLIARARRVNRDAPYWEDLDGYRTRLSLALFAFDHGSSEDMDQMSEDEWQKAWATVGTARERPVTKVEEVTGVHPMAPPPRPGTTVSRVWGRRPTWLGRRAQASAGGTSARPR